MNPLTPVDPPETIEIGLCPKCDGIYAGAENVWDDDYPKQYFVLCRCGFKGPARSTAAEAAEVFNEIESKDLLDDCEQCGGHYALELQESMAGISGKTLHRVRCGCGGSTSWERDKGEAIDNHNSLQGLIRGQ